MMTVECREGIGQHNYFLAQVFLSERWSILWIVMKRRKYVWERGEFL
jgi:hypothetical protein